MLRMHDKKPDVPEITVEHLTDLISAYYAKKTSNRRFFIRWFSSPTMCHLQQFLHTQLANKTGKLSINEVFEFCKIIFAHNHRDGQISKYYIHSAELIFLDERVTAAFHSAVTEVGKLDPLAEHFAVICRNPSIAPAITFSVLLLDHMINHPLAFSAGKVNTLFSKKTYDAMKIEPQYGVDVLAIYKLTATGYKDGTPVFKDINQLLASDALSYICLKLYQAGQFEMETFTNIRSCKADKLIELAEKIDIASSPIEVIRNTSLTAKKEIPLNYSTACYREEEMKISPGMRPR